MSDSVIRVEHLSKKYLLRHERQERYASLRDVVSQRVRALGRGVRARVRSSAACAGPRPPAREEFWALRDVSLEIHRAERVGIVGRNGAGKSTLLKILSRITEPTAGRIELEGRVASLLEVGTGFHQELTGRENIFLNGAILGMGRREIRRKFDEIVAFAEVEKFLDTPVKRYSSGMYVRLAFAVAAHLEPEILIVDEVLAVGDFEFQKKCLGKMEAVGREGRTVVFVSHNMAAVRLLCPRLILLEEGRVVFAGATEEGIARYLAPDRGERAGTILSFGSRTGRDVEVTSVRVNGSESPSVRLAGGRLEIAVQGRARRDLKLDIEALVYTGQGMLLGTFCPTRRHGNLGTVKAGAFHLRSTIRLPGLTRGRYTVHLLLTHPNVQGYWEFPGAVELECDGVPFANGAVTGCESSGPIFLEGETEYCAAPAEDEPGAAAPRS